MTDAENIDWDVCPECGYKLEREKRRIRAYGGSTTIYVDYCPSCGWEEGSE